MRPYYLLILLLVFSPHIFAERVLVDSGGKGNSSPNTKHLYLKSNFSSGLSHLSVQNLSANQSAKYRLLLGAGFSLVMDNPHIGKLSIGTQYQAGGVKVADKDINGSGNDNKIQLNYLSMPVKYQFYLGKTGSFCIGGGGYGALLVSKKQSIRLFNLENFKKYDAGLLASAGIQLLPRWTLEANAQWGLVQIDNSTGARAARNGFVFITLGFVTIGKASSLSSRGPIIKIKPKGG